MPLIRFSTIDVGNKRQLFIDDQFIDQAAGVELVLHPPVDCGPVIEEDRPWEPEGTIYGYCCVLQDPLEDGLHRLFYYTSCRPPVLAALSRDGVHWDKPEVGMHEFEGSTANNMLPVYDTSAQAWRTDIAVEYPFVDPHDVPERRLKNFSRPSSDDSKPILVCSGDGLRWETDGKLQNDVSTDGSEVIFWDDRIGRYVLYGRASGRSISRMELEDLTAWPFFKARDAVIRTDYLDAYAETLDGPIIMSRERIDSLQSTLKPFPWAHKEWDPDIPGAPGFTDRPEWADGVDIYEPTTTKYPFAENIYLQPLNLFYHKPNLFEVQLAVSRDGIDWSRPGDRRPWVRLPDDSEGIHVMHAAPGLVRNGNEVYHYVGFTSLWHGGAAPADAHLEKTPEYPKHGAIHRLKLRLDGYMSATAGNREGTFITPPMVFEGSKLLLNVDTSASGYMRVEMLDGWIEEESDCTQVDFGYNAPGRGMPIPGFTLAECEQIVANSCHRQVAWKESADVSAWQGKPIRLRFALRNARLYAFQFTD